MESIIAGIIVIIFILNWIKVEQKVNETHAVVKRIEQKLNTESIKKEKK